MACGPRYARLTIEKRSALARTIHLVRCVRDPIFERPFRDVVAPISPLGSMAFSPASQSCHCCSPSLALAHVRRRRAYRARTCFQRAYRPPSSGLVHIRSPRPRLRPRRRRRDPHPHRPPGATLLATARALPARGRVEPSDATRHRSWERGLHQQFAGTSSSSSIRIASHPTGCGTSWCRLRQESSWLRSRSGGQLLAPIGRD